MGSAGSLCGDPNLPYVSFSNDGLTETTTKVGCTQPQNYASMNLLCLASAMPSNSLRRSISFLTTLVYTHPPFPLLRRTICAKTPSPTDNMPNVANLRVNYTAPNPFPTPLPPTPHPLFDSWLSAAVASGNLEPNAMSLSTVSSSGRPTARIVLLKRFDEKGFVWYTNYDSHKATHLAQNPFAALVFWWPILERSVRVEGSVTKVPSEESDEYFQSRPTQSRLGAWASDQSRPVEGRHVLEGRLQTLQADFLDEEGGVKQKIERPQHWGGYRLDPDRIEFWKGCSARLHDRIVYIKEGDDWSVHRLQP